MRPRERQSSPAVHQGASDVGEDTATSLAPITLTGTDVLRGHAVLVETPAGKVTRRLYLSLHAADRALARAHARGQVATMVLLELRPVVR